MFKPKLEKNEMYPGHSRDTYLVLIALAFVLGLGTMKFIDSRYLIDMQIELKQCGVQHAK